MTTTTSRADVVSSFTLIKGALIEETYEVFTHWDLGRTKRENLDILRAENYIGAPSVTWLRDVAWVLNRRYDPDGRDRALVLLAKGGCPLEVWKAILLWHMTRDEFLLRDFLQNWLYPVFEEGVYRIGPSDLDDYLRGLATRGGVTEHEWSETTRRRVAAGLLKVAFDFGLLRGATAKEFAGYHIPEQSLLYLLHAFRDAGMGAQKLIASPEWRMFLLRPADVEREILRLHQFHKLRYEVAGSIVELSLPKSTALEFAEAMAA